MKVKLRQLGVIIALLPTVLVGNKAIAAPDFLIATANGQPGNVVTLPVSYTGNSTVVGMQFDIVYDAASLSLTGAVAGSAANQANLASSELIPGRRKVTLTPSSGQPAIPSGTLLYLPFYVNERAVIGIKRVAVENVVLTSASSQSIAYTSLTAGSISTQLFSDKDNDGLPDAFEVSHGLNSLDSSDAALDLDGDGRTALQEFESPEFGWAKVMTGATSDARGEYSALAVDQSGNVYLVGGMPCLIEEVLNKYIFAIIT